MSESTPRFCSEITIENHPLPPKKNNNEIWKSYSSMNFTFATQENPKKKVQSEINSHHNFKLNKVSNKKNQKISFSHSKIRKFPPSKFTLFLIHNLKVIFCSISFFLTLFFKLRIKNNVNLLGGSFLILL